MKTLRLAGDRIVKKVLVGFGLGMVLASARAGGPTIVFTTIPSYGSSGALSGTIRNADPATNCVAVFIYVAGGWYSKPSCANQLTPIQPDGSWTANITPNVNDVYATEIAAFLVPTNYNQPCVNGAAGLPIPSQAEAVAYANRVNPGARRLVFSGYGWHVRNTTGLSGPGPNYFSDSTNNVWVDAQGALHLKITHTNGVWPCAEIVSDRSFGYGQYRFTVSAPVNTLDPSAVLGLFTWSDDSAYNNREIDMELSRWNYAFGSNNVEDYAVAPYAPSQVLRIPLPAGVTNSTHSFIWETNNVTFQSLNGVFTSPPTATNLLESWSCGTAIPPAGGEQVHMNLWLNKGNPPTDNQPVEVVISNFEFVPLGSPQSAKINRLTRLPDGAVQLNLQGGSDWHYEILSSSNLQDWVEAGTVIATNDFFQFIATNPVSQRLRFYRALTKP